MKIYLNSDPVKYTLIDYYYYHYEEKKIENNIMLHYIRGVEFLMLIMTVTVMKSVNDDDECLSYLV